MAKVVVEFKDFSFQYKAQQKPTLHDINLKIREGEKVLILGASGSGKSTLVNCINGIIPFSLEGNVIGSCKVNDIETSQLSIFELSKSVGTVLQDSDAQFVGLSVGEDIAFAMENNNTPREEMLPKVFAQSQKVGMEAFLAALPFNLSGGQKQKVALAGVLAEEMNILIFDEPLASLDPQTGTKAIDLIDQIARLANRTTIIVEHRLEDVLFRPVDRIIMLDEGRIVADMPPLELLKSDILKRYGIREPLYLTALKYAKCDLEDFTKLDNVAELDISDQNKKKLKAFFAQEINSPTKTFGSELLKVDNVSYSYEPSEPPVVSDISFSVHKGERLAIIGKNGAGKSTIARLVCGIGRPKTGHIYLSEEDYLTLSVKEIGEKVGYVMQNPNQMLVKDIIKEEVELALTLHNLPQEEVEERSLEALRICDLYRMRNWPIDSVSYGQKKRVTIADILALKPNIIILDEPTAGQDYRRYMEIIGFINRLNEEYGLTIIFITHDMHLAIENTDRAIVFTDGKVIADDQVFTVLSDDEIIKQANLKQTSLYTLADKLGLKPEMFIERYIYHERQARDHE